MRIEVVDFESESFEDVAHMVPADVVSTLMEEDGDCYEVALVMVLDDVPVAFGYCEEDGRTELYSLEAGEFLVGLLAKLLQERSEPTLWVHPEDLTIDPPEGTDCSIRFKDSLESIGFEMGMTEEGWSLMYSG